MADHSNSPGKPKFSAEIIKERLRTMTVWLEQVGDFARALDWLGPAEKHAAGSDELKLVNVRDEVDFALSHFLRRASTAQRLRAETTHCLDLLINAAVERQGDGYDALHLMRRYHALSGDETHPVGEIAPESFPDSFAWDTYQRVSALAELVEQFPEHIRHSARQMHGWPMIVSAHLDLRTEFQRVREHLSVGADYPLDVGPRRRRGTDGPLLRYLEPLVWRLHVTRLVLRKTEKTWRGEKFARRLYGFWWEFPDPQPSPEILAVLKLVPTLSPLTQTTAREWSRKVIVPLIMLEDAGDPESCNTPALRNIWHHRSVKSRATFQSRLHSAVTDTSERFGRPG
jgi:hypothetical protein